jgi:hypothetical protein
VPTAPGLFLEREKFLWAGRKILKTVKLQIIVHLDECKKGHRVHNQNFTLIDLRIKSGLPKKP